MIEICEYFDLEGKSPFGEWFRRLNVHAGAKVATALERLTDGNLARVKAVGSGVLECKIDFGPGYRIYFGRVGVELVILLGGGTKKRQAADIRKAASNWAEYHLRRRSKTRETGE